jgi:outer membrane protein assembly factor BamB
MRFASLCLAIGLLACCGCEVRNETVVPDFRAGDLPELARTLPRRAGGRGGWKVPVAEGQQLTTPTVVDGRVFIGAGVGSREFSAYDAASGDLLWRYHPSDNGPTAAAVGDGCVVFNTESCELEVLDYDGNPLWKKWLGDPLLSAPTLGRGRVYTAYPNWRRSYILACYELSSSNELWTLPIPAEIITAPVLHDNLLLISTLDGTVSCFDSTSGEPLWTEAAGATSAPAVGGAACYFSRLVETEGSRSDSGGKRRAERIAWRGLERRAEIRDFPETERDLTQWKLVDDVSERSAFANVLSALSRSASDAPNHTSLSEANLLEIWSFQGSRPCLDEDNLYAAIGYKVVCVALATKAPRWEMDLTPAAGGDFAESGLFKSHLSPAALVNDKLFLGTRDGRIVCLSAATGEVNWTEVIGEPIVCQPAVAGGRVYVGTTAGSLVAVETGDEADDGWQMWGANAARSGQAKAAYR